MANDLTRMMDEVHRARLASSAKATPARYPEASPAPQRISPDETPWDGVMPEEGFVKSPQQLPEPNLKPTPPEFESINFISNTISTTDGRSFHLEPEARKDFAILCIQALRLHTERTIERMARNYGLWVDAPTTPPDGAAETPQPPVASNADAVPTGKGLVRRRGRPPKERRGDSES